MLKKGDKVKIKNNLETQKYYGNILFLPEMTQLKGKEVTILNTIKLLDIDIYEIEGSGSCWSKEMFEPIEENPMPKLESGMFVKNHVGIYGVVAGNKIVYKDGGYDFVYDVIEDDGYIVQIIETIFGFDGVKTGKVIWEYKEKKEEKPKTYLEDFMKNNPDYKCDIYKIPYLCAGRYYDFYCPKKVSCKDCWNASKGTWE